MVVFNNELYSISYDGVVGRFDVTGNGWVEVRCLNMPPNNNFQPTIQIANNNLIVTTDIAMHTSSDGTNWDVPALHGIPNGHMGQKVCPQSIVGYNGDLIGTCGKYGIFYSWNGGDDWLPFTTSTPFIANFLRIINNQLYAGSFYQGIWSSSVILSGDNSGKHIYDNGNIFPNPCSDYLKINLPEDVLTDRLLITDNLGRKIIDREFDKNNNEINTSQLPEGIYYVQVLNTEKIIGSYKLAVIR